MRTMRWYLVLTLVACGASTKEIATAKQAEYKASAKIGRASCRERV